MAVFPGNWKPPAIWYTHTHLYICMHAAFLIRAGDKDYLWKNGFPLCSYCQAHHTIFNHQVWYFTPWNTQCSKDERSHLQGLIANHLSDSNSQQEFPSILFSFPVQLITKCWEKRGFGLSIWEIQCRCLLIAIRTFESRDGSFKIKSQCI